MNVSPYKPGAYVRIKDALFLKEDFDARTSPLAQGEIGIISAVAASGDRRPRYVQVNGKAGFHHFSLFEDARPSFWRKLYLILRYWPSLVINPLLTWKGPFLDGRP